MKNAKIINSFFWVSIDRGGILIIQFLALIILSRLLTPYDFGLIGILTIFINLSIMLVDSGMVGALIAKKEVSNTDYSTLFIFNFGISLTIYGILFFTAPFIAIFYDIPALSLIIRVLSISIIFNAAGLIQSIQLTREYRFKTQSVITITSQTTSVAIAIYMARIGFGVWALVLMQVIQSALNTMLLYIINRSLPKLIFSNQSFKAQFAFGMPLLFSNIITVINNSITSSVLGKLFSPTQTGFFAQSLKLQNVPTGIMTAVIDKVAFTILSKKDTLEDLKLLGNKIYKYVYIIAFPILFYVIIVAETLFVFLLGDKWLNAAWVFKILSYSLIPLTIKILNRNLLKSSGKTGLILKMEVVNIIIALIILFATTLISFEAIVYGVTASNIFMSITSLYFVHISMKQTVREQISVFLKPLIISLFAFIITIIIFNNFDLNGLYELFATALFFFFTVIVIYFITNVISIKNAFK